MPLISILINGKWTAAAPSVAMPAQVGMVSTVLRVLNSKKNSSLVFIVDIIAYQVFVRNRISSPVLIQSAIS
jgi:hypothetical protein